MDWVMVGAVQLVILATVLIAGALWSWIRVKLSNWAVIMDRSPRGFPVQLQRMLPVLPLEEISEPVNPLDDPFRP